MHILHIISTMDPAAGGPAEGVRLLLSMTDEHWTGEVVTLDAPDAPFLRALPFTVHAIGPIRSTYGYARTLLPWLTSNRHRFDGFLVNGMWQYCGLATMLAARCRIPYMVYAHGMLDPYFKRRFPLKHVKKILYWYPIEYWVLRRAWRVLFTTEAERILARESFALASWRPAIVPYGIASPETSREENIAAFHNSVPALKSRRFIVFLGRIHPKKGCDLLMEAFCSLATLDPDLHLLMAGPDPDNWAAKLVPIATAAGVADRIHWPGILRGPAKWGAFQAAEAFILPSHQENFGIAVVEALACGLPVLLSSEVNVESVINDAGCSYIEPDTLEGTRRLLQRWIGTPPPTREAMARAATACFTARFDLRETVSVIYKLFTEAAASGRYTGTRR